MTFLPAATRFFMVLALVLAFGAVEPAAAQSYIRLTNTNANSYTQNFDTLGIATVSNVISATAGVQASLGDVANAALAGWYAAKIGGTGTAATSIVANNGSANSGAVYNYGSANAPSDSDRSLGALSSGSTVPAFGAMLVNETSETLAGVRLSFTAKFWRSSTSAQNVLTFGFGIVDVTSFSADNFLSKLGAATLTAANVVGPPPAATSAALDGNNPANQSMVSNLTIPVSLAPGAVMFIRWQDANETGNDAGLAIDDLSVTPLTGTPPATAPFLSSTTVPPSGISRTQAGVSSSVTGDGGSPVTERGFVYAVESVNAAPVIGGTGVTKIPDASAEVGAMSQTVTGLTAATSYAIRSYASNAVGISYGSVATFSTLGPPLSFGGSYSESFSTYTNTLPAGWTALSSSNVSAYEGNWGTGSAGGFRGVGPTTGNVLGYQHTASTGMLTVAVTFTNSTGSILDALSISYLGRTALPANSRLPGWVVSVNGNAVEALAYSTGNTDGEGGAPADQTKSAQLTGLGIAPGAEFTITWVSERGAGSGSSRQIGLADFSISAFDPTAPSIVPVPSSITNFTATQGSESASRQVTVTGSNLGGNNITVTSSNNLYVISTNGFATGGVNSLTLAPTGGSVEVRISTNAPVTTNLVGNLSLSGGGATNNVSLRGTVTNPNAPNLSVSPASLTSFVTTAGTASAAKTFTVTGTNLQAEMIVTPPSGYQVSLDGNSWTSTLTVPRAYNAFDDFYVNVPATGGEGSYTRTTWIANAGTVPFDTGLTNPNTWGYAGGNFNGVGAPSSVGAYVSGGNFYPLTSGGSLAGPGASYALGGGNFWIGYNDQYAVATPGQTQIGKYTKEWFAGSPNHTGNPDGTNNKFLWLQGTGLQSSTDGLGAILTWTAPNAGTFTFKGSYVNGNYGPSTSFAIVDSLNNTNLAKQTLAPSSSTNSFSFTRTYSAGDVVQFQVGTPAASQGSPLGLSVEVTPALTVSRLVYVRIAPSATAGPLAGNVSVASAGADTQNVAVSGTVSPAPASSLTLSGALTNFATPQGVASAPQSFVVQGNGLTSNVTVSAPANLQFTTNTSSSYSASLVLPINGGALSNTVFARIPDTAAIGGPTTNVITATSGATNVAFNVVTTVSSNTNPFILADPTSLSGFSTTEGAPSTNLQTFTVAGTNLAGNLNVSAPAGFQISTNGTSFVSSLSLVPVGGTPVVTNLATDDGDNYADGWTNGANGGTGFGAWTIASTNGTGGFGGVFIGNPTAAGITTNATFGTNSFGMYANPGTSGAFANADRTFAALQDGQTFSFQWAINWDSDVGNKGFSLYSGGTSGTQLLNVNQGGFPGDIRFIGGGVTNTNVGLAYGTGPMTWSFAMTSSNNLLVTSSPRDGATGTAFSTNFTVAAGPDSFRWYASAMSQGDQRQQYYNNLKIVGTTASGNVAPTTIYVRLSGAAAGAASGNIDLTSSGAPSKVVALSGTVLPRPVITPNAGLAPFSADLGVASSAQPFTFVGTNLVGSVTVTAPTGYEVSKTTNGAYTNTLTYTPAEAQPGPATNWVRLATNAPAGFVSGNVSLASQGAVTTNVAVTGRVIGNPVIALSPTNLTNFFAASGTNSDAQSFVARGVDLDGPIVLTATNASNWEIRDPADGVYKTTVTLAASNSVPVTFARDSATNAAYAAGWTNNSDGGNGFGPWIIQAGGSATATIGNPADAGITGMNSNSFALQGTNSYATAQRQFDGPLLPGDTFSLQFGNNFDTGSGGNKGVNIYAGGFAETNQVININMGGSAAITIRQGTNAATDMFTQYGTAAVTLNFQYVAAGQLRVFGTGRNGTETFDQTFAVAAAPDGLSLYAGDLAADQVAQRVLYANDFAITSGSVGPAVDPTEILVRIKGGAELNPALTGSVDATSTGAAPAVVSLAGIVSDRPKIDSTANLQLFSAVQGFPSGTQQILVGGSNLDADVSVAPPTGYELSLDGVAWSSGAVVVPRMPGITPQQVVYIRIISGLPVGGLNGEIMLRSSGASDVNIAVNGQVIANSGAQLAANPSSLAAFSTTVGSASAARTFLVTGTAISDGIVLTAPAGFQISTNGTNFFSSNTLTPPASGAVSNTISVRLAGTTSGILTGTVSATSGTNAASVSVQGTVFAAGGSIAASPAFLTGFTAVEGAPSAAQSFLASARNLGSSSLVATASPGYQVSTNSTNFFAGSATVTPVSGAVGPLPLYVRIADTTPVTNDLSGTVTLSAGANTPLPIPLSGKVDPRRPPVVTLIQPSSSPTTIAPGATISLRAGVIDTNAAGEPGTIATFEFMTNGVPLPGSLVTNVLSPAAFKFDWTPSAGVLPATVTAQAVDSEGLTNTSASVLVRNPDPGQPIPGFAPARPDGPVFAFSADPLVQHLYVGGQFGKMFSVEKTPVLTNPGTFVSTTNTNIARNVAKLDAATGAFQTNFSADPGGPVTAMAYGLTNGVLTNAWVYVAGRFADVSSRLVTNRGVVSTKFTTNLSVLKRLDPVTGDPDPAFKPDLLGTNSLPGSRALCLTFATNGNFNGWLLVGGSFAGSLKMVNPTNGQVANVPAKLNGTVNAVAVDTNGKILVGGRFNVVSGRPRAGLARLTARGSLDLGFRIGAGPSGGFNGPVNALALGINGSIYVGGSFATFNGGSSRNMLVALDASGVLQGSFNFAPGFNNAVNTLLARPDGKLLVGGQFVSAGNRILGFSVPAGRVLQMQASGQPDATFNPGGSGANNNAVFAFSLLPNGNVAVGGSFTSFNGDPSLSHLAILTGTPPSSPSTTALPKTVVPRSETTDDPATPDQGEGTEPSAVPQEPTAPAAPRQSWAPPWRIDCPRGGPLPAAGKIWSPACAGQFLG